MNIPIRVEEGRIRIHVLSADQETVLCTAIVNPLEPTEVGKALPIQTIELPFSTGAFETVRFVLRNQGSKAQAGPTTIIGLGPTSYLWTRYLRLAVHTMQKGFFTACVLPFALTGALRFLWKRQWQTLALLLIVPAYYLVVQSALHTERRYVMAVHYFSFTLAAIAIVFVAEKVAQLIGSKGAKLS
jgi:hypothetical protein